jgi:hypothetical protein
MSHQYNSLDVYFKDHNLGILALSLCYLCFKIHLYGKSSLLTSRPCILYFFVLILVQMVRISILIILSHKKIHVCVIPVDVGTGGTSVYNKVSACYFRIR